MEKPGLLEIDFPFLVGLQTPSLLPVPSLPPVLLAQILFPVGNAQVVACLLPMRVGDCGKSFCTHTPHSQSVSFPSAAALEMGSLGGLLPLGPSLGDKLKMERTYMIAVL